MKATRNILLFLGTAGLSAAIFGLLNGDALMDQLMTMICGASLIYGYVDLGRSKKESASH
ncbi:MAG: hypothetical protein HRU26_12765 [Psychroserpens sp.]|nr:hypothetical protein [Psychroserpens sp.]